MQRSRTVTPLLGFPSGRCGVSGPELDAVAWSPGWSGLLLLVLTTAAWVVARGTGVLVVEQFSAIAMIPAAVFAVLGWPAVRTLALPLPFCFSRCRLAERSCHG